MCVFVYRNITSVSMGLRAFSSIITTINKDSSFRVNEITLLVFSLCNQLNVCVVRLQMFSI